VLLSYFYSVLETKESFLALPFAYLPHGFPILVTAASLFGLALKKQ
jgi:hypothetical protein